MGKMIIGLLGQAGTGKDTIADILVARYSFIKVAHADPLKRAAQQVFDFTDAQLWGPSELREVPDKRYPRDHGPFTVDHTCVVCGINGASDNINNESCYLTPRFVLQRGGTEWGRTCCSSTWTQKLHDVIQVIQQGGCRYDAKTGIHPIEQDATRPPRTDVVVSDVRNFNEVQAIHAAGGKVARVVRHNRETKAAGMQHQSETEVSSVPEELVDYVLHNVGDLHYLELQAGRMLGALRGQCPTVLAR